jgi:ubiquitin-protein ligase
MYPPSSMCLQNIGKPKLYGNGETVLIKNLHVKESWSTMKINVDTCLVDVKVLLSMS